MRASTACSFAEYQRTRYFTGLDGLRAVAILGVLAHHVPPFSSALAATLQDNGRFGVSLFFIISGFLICTLFLREKAATGRVNLPGFYARRALRLLPLYYAVLASEALLVFALHQYSPENQLLFRAKLPAYLLYFSNWLPTATQGPFFVAWSLAVEEQFYLVFGFLFCFARRRTLVTGLGVLLGLKFAVYQLFGSIDAHSTLWRIVFSYQEPILWGVLLAFLLNQQRSYRLIVSIVHAPSVPLGLPLLILGGISFHRMATQSTWDAELLFILLTAGIARVATSPRSAFSWRPLAHIGTISYGIYLLHMPVLSAVKKVFGAHPGVCLLLTTLLVIALASVVYRYLERPLIDYYKARFSAKRPVCEGRPEPAPAPVVSTAP